MLTDTLKTIVNNLFKENFYEKKKINVLQFFPLIFYGSNVKTFLKLIINQCLKAPVNMTLNFITFHVCVCTPKMLLCLLVRPPYGDLIYRTSTTH